MSTADSTNGTAQPVNLVNLPIAPPSRLTSSPDLSESCPSPESGALGAPAPKRKDGDHGYRYSGPSHDESGHQDRVTLVAKYKGTDHTCEVVEHDERLHYLPPGRGRARPKVFNSPSAAGREITGSQVNGYRFWSVPEKTPSGRAAPEGGSGGGRSCRQDRVSVGGRRDV